MITFENVIHLVTVLIFDIFCPTGSFAIRGPYVTSVNSPASGLASSLKTLRVFFALAPSQVQVPVMGP